MAKGPYAEIYERAMNWHKAHRKPSSQEDWAKIARDLHEFDRSEFENALGVAIVEEIERVNNVQLLDGGANDAKHTEIPGHH